MKSPLKHGRPVTEHELKQIFTAQHAPSSATAHLGALTSFTHGDNTPKERVTVTWRSPLGYSGRVRALATAAKSFRTFWTNVGESEDDGAGLEFDVRGPRLEAQSRTTRSGSSRIASSFVGLVLAVAVVAAMTLHLV